VTDRTSVEPGAEGPTTDASATTARSLAAVEAERAAELVADREAERRRRSFAGRTERILRWLGDSRTGPVARLRRMGRVLIEIGRSPRALPALPAALITAARIPPLSPPLPPPRPPRPLEPDRAAARERLMRFDAWVAAREGPLRVALIADGAPAEPADAAGEIVALRPEDWRVVLQVAPPRILVVTAPRGPGGPWRYRIGWYAHPDALLQRDVWALLGWCAERDIPAIFWDRGGPAGVRTFRATAALCDLIVSDDPLTAARYAALPDRRGAGVAVWDVPHGGSMVQRLREGLMTASTAS